jgi:nucleoside-diphosphate-sugar epimerase
VVVILGLGFTGARVAWRLLRRGVEVWAPVRGVGRFDALARAGVQISELTLEQPELMQAPENSIAVITIPPLPEPAGTQLHEVIRHIRPRRVVYVSSTGVYGDQVDVDADTPNAPADERGRARLEDERRIASGSWSSLILRAAAIYGPGRGVHASIRQGKLPRGIGSGVTSRVHVDDLAAILEAGIFSDLEGAWPVADEAPCSTAEIVRWCREVLNLKTPEVAAMLPTAGRRVNGQAIRAKLNVALKYPSWETGIPASIAEEVRPPEPSEPAR